MKPHQIWAAAGPQGLSHQNSQDETPLVNTWATLINSYWPLLVAAGTGVVMSYVYITLLRFRAAMLVQLGMVMLFLGPLTTGDDQSRIVRIVTAFGLDQI